MNPFKKIRDLGLDETIPLLYRPMGGGTRSIEPFIGSPTTKRGFLALPDRKKLLVTIQFSLFSFLGFLFFAFGVSGVFWGHPELLIFGLLFGGFLGLVGLPGLALATYIYKNQSKEL